MSMYFRNKLGIEYYKNIPLLKHNGDYEAYDKRKKAVRSCSLYNYNEEIANVHWKDTNRDGKIPLENLVCKSVIPKGSDLLQIDLVLDSQNCWSCNQKSYYILGLEIIYDNQYMQFNSNVSEEIVSQFKKYKLNKYQIGEVKERYSKTREESYMSNGCYHCDALFGSFYIGEDITEYQIYSSWPEGIDTIEITYEKYFELNKESLVFDDSEIFEDRLEYLNEDEHLTMQEEDSACKMDCYKTERFTYGDLDFYIKKGSLGLELYCGNVFVKSVESLKEGKIKALGYAEQLQRLQKELLY